MKSILALVLRNKAKFQLENLFGLDYEQNQKLKR